MRALLLLVVLLAGCGLRWTDPHEDETFPLRGAHVALECEACHAGGSEPPTSCEGCHETDRPLPHWDGACATCHDEEAWGTFVHDTFALEDAHAVECLSCHVGGTLELDPTCTSCHETDRPNAHFVGQECGTCHTPTTWGAAVVDHAFFPIGGAHDVTCETCHTGGGYDGLDPACTACHEDERPAEHFPGQECSECHPITEWGDGVFAHPDLALAGPHDLACETCHTNGTWQGLDATCATCHEADRPAGHFPGQECGECHPPTDWRDGTFAHPSTLPLAGPHDVACETCHTNGTYLGLDTSCTSCHEADRPVDHFDGLDCEECHPVTSWDAGVFDHQRLFPLPHRDVSQCAECHLGGDVTTFSCTHCHEHRQSEAASEHQGVANYAWVSQRCFDCHPRGQE